MDTPTQITLTGTDPIPGDVLKFSLVSLPQNGKLVTRPASHTVTYTPNNGFTGTDSFTYKGTDGQGVSSNIATVTIIVSNATPGSLDKFGVKELHPSKPGGEQWFFNSDNPNTDPRTGKPNENPA